MDNNSSGMPLDVTALGYDVPDATVCDAISMSLNPVTEGLKNE